jgi:hypothetical protein
MFPPARRTAAVSAGTGFNQAERRKDKMLMRNITRSIRGGELRKVLYVLILAMGIIGVLPDTGGAVVIPADEAGSSALRAQNVEKIRATLERKEIAARLMDFGLTPEEVSSRLINAGGDIFGTLLTIALVVLLVLVILHLLGYVDLKLPKRKKAPPA